MSSNASGWRLTGGAALAQAGAAGLALVLITTCDGDDGDDGCEWSGLLTGGLASVFAVPAGVQLAGTRRTYGRLLLGSIAGIIAGWGIAEAFHSAGVEGDGLLMIVPITQIGTTVVAGL